MSERGEERDVLVSLLTSERIAKGLSMREVARRAGVTPSCIHGWEHGQNSPTLGSLRAWAGAVGCRITLTTLTPPADLEDGAR